MFKCVLSLGIIMLGVAASATDDAAVRAAIDKLMPGQDDVQITAAALPGMREVAIGTQVFYVSADGAYVLGGPLIATRSGHNYTDARVGDARRAILDRAVAVETYLFAAPQARHRVTVITDIDCPYCRRLHSDLPQFAAAGIEVEYIMLPRAGVGSPSYLKTVSAACAANPEAAITQAMNGTALASQQCDHPIDRHMALARELGITSTPTIVLADGRLLLGQQKPDDVLRAIGAAAPPAR